MEILSKWMRTYEDVRKILDKANIHDYALFQSPQNHLIVVTTSDNRETILNILKQEYDVIENDSWFGGSGLGIIVE